MSNAYPLVTIVLPVYNGERTLATTLKSLINQTYSNFELLIGIDGTTDGSKAIAQSLNDNRIQIIEHVVNLGLGPNVNHLISLASPESVYIAMAEQDDVYVSERLEWQVELMESNKDIGLVSGIAEFVSENNRILFPGILIKRNQFPQGKTLFEYLYINQLKVVNTCMMFRKAIHCKHHLKFTNVYGNHNADWDYVLRFALISEVHGLHKKLVSMNRAKHFNSVTTDKKKQHLMSKQFLKDFKIEFPNLISTSVYRKALKMHRKIELGHRSKFGIIIFSIYYYIIYMDAYFLKYIGKRISKFMKNKKSE